jgi:hypothetical protein
MVQLTELYKCRYCGSTFEDEDDALDCQKDCLTVDMEPPKIVTNAKCECCGHLYGYEDDAKKCEQKHEEREDIYYNNYLSQVNQKKLEEAAAQPGQLKLIL